MKIGQNIRKVRELNDLNQETVANMLGMSAVAYGRIERNESDISLKRINQIAKALNTDIETLLNFDSKKHIVQMENNKGTIYTSINYGTVNTVNEGLLQTIANLNDNIVQLNSIVLQLTKK
ncbi:MAG: helix-turn-helix transcriptional regulator [Vicingaceae bacterium]|nr:helix-turn-helix transcriptional regulator [Vicingaceae bacterium]